MCEIRIRVLEQKLLFSKIKFCTSVRNSNYKTYYLMYEMPKICEMVREIYKVQLKINPFSLPN
jgi:hypothetical protein